MRQINFTAEMILDKLSDNPEQFPTKDDWIKYVSEFAHKLWDEATLLLIENGGTTTNDESNEAFKTFYTTLMRLGDLVWEMYNG